MIFAKDEELAVAGLSLRIPKFPHLLKNTSWCDYRRLSIKGRGDFLFSLSLYVISELCSKLCRLSERDVVSFPLLVDQWWRWIVHPVAILRA